MLHALCSPITLICLNVSNNNQHPPLKEKQVLLIDAENLHAVIKLHLANNIRPVVEDT